MIEQSVLVRTHNHAPFIAECIESLLGQTEPPGEIIAYDNGSRDDTVRILRSYGERIRLIEGRDAQRPSHIAEAEAVQAAFSISRGRIIFLVDGDDRFKPEKIARYTTAFESHPDASVVQAPLDRINQRGESAGVLLEPRKHITNHLREIYRQHDVNFFYPTSALAFSRYYIERVLPLELEDGLPLWTDTRLCIPAAYYGRIVTLPDPLTDWRYHTRSDAMRIRSRTAQIRQAMFRTRVFNTFCRRHGLRTISLWRNRRLYLHIARYVMPDAVSDFYFNRILPIFTRVG